MTSDHNKEKAPAAAATADEGTIPEGTIDMSTTTVQDAEAAVEVSTRAKTMPFSTRTRFTREEWDIARAEGLHLLDQYWVTLNRKRSPDFQTLDGNTFRTAGRLYIRTCLDGQRRYVGYMYPDATIHDFKFFEKAIVIARHGRMDGWRRHTFKDGDEGWIFDYNSFQLDGLTNFVPAKPLAKTSWGYTCDESLCIDGWHENEDAAHTLFTNTTALGESASCEIEVCKDISKPDSDWYVCVWPSEDLSQLNPSNIADLVNDLQWAAEECRRANNPVKVAA